MLAIALVDLRYGLCQNSNFRVLPWLNGFSNMFTMCVVCGANVTMQLTVTMSVS